MGYPPQGVGLPMQVKDKNDDGRITQLAIGAFISFAGLIIVLITQLKLYNLNIIIILLIVMLLILISGFYGKPIYKILDGYFQKRRYNKLAKSDFKRFKELVIRFKEFTENRQDNIQMTMHYIKNTLPGQSPFSQINVVQPIFIEQRYEYYMERLNQFNGTKDSLVALAKEFESILFMYDMLYINEPVQKIRNIVSQSATREDVPKQYKESYNKARLKYIYFLNDYKNFAKIANEASGLGGGTVFRDYFDFPEEL